MEPKRTRKHATLVDADMIGIVDKLIQQRKLTVSTHIQAGRQDLAEKENARIELLETYLPQHLCDEEVAAEVKAIVAELGAKGSGDLGKVMGAAKTRLAGKAEMGQVSAAVKAALAG